MCSRGPSYPPLTSGPEAAVSRDDLRVAVKEAIVFLNSFPALVKQLNALFNTTHFTAFDLSLGDAAAVGSLYGYDRLLSAINMDGTFFGRPALNTNEADVGKPSFLFGMEIHAG
ncbi:hypothetical protein DL764_001160 [Monosporascus ibericus]|uniref:Uncharacterized protein n=1 Tax=Monosporascus ibericus TaxID=155417 RepID=A0A4Q4TS92_9PEZI|nr:hypothetical protein DL764_001160 [Monosporascus ibericus]